MPNPEELIQALAELDPATLENVINTAYNRRRDPVRPARPDPVEGPGPFARWLAQRHMETDAAIERVVYLPTGAPNNEIRLLEVNRFSVPDILPLTCDTDSRVFVPHPGMDPSPFSDWPSSSDQTKRPASYWCFLELDLISFPAWPSLIPQRRRVAGCGGSSTWKRNRDSAQAARTPRSADRPEISAGLGRCAFRLPKRTNPDLWPHLGTDPLRRTSRGKLAKIPTMKAKSRTICLLPVMLWCTSTIAGAFVFLSGASHVGGREPSYRDRQRCGVLGR